MATIPRRHPHLTALIATLLIASAGCSVADLSTPERLDRGLVVILPGIEGRSRLNVGIARGLDEGGVKTAIEIFDWGTSVPGGALINLTDLERNQRLARELRNRIMTYRRHYPGRCIHVVGHSGGGGLAVLTAESIPRDVQITSVILLAPAISPKHDLCRALRRVEGGIYNFHSKHDTAFLVLGTSVFGTIDRDYGASAGAVGFNRPPDLPEASATLYNKLHQIPWEPTMKAYGHRGGHTGCTHPAFVSHYVAPIIIRTTRVRKEWPISNPGWPDTPGAHDEEHPPSPGRGLPGKQEARNPV